MPRPNSLKIGNHRYKIQWGTIFNPDGSYLYGRTLARRSLIEVDDANSVSQQRDTLLHEVMHAVFSDAFWNLDGDDEERIIRALTPGLLATLRENKTLVSFLLEKDT